MCSSLLHLGTEIESNAGTYPVLKGLADTRVNPIQYLMHTIDSIRSQDKAREQLGQPWTPEPILYPEHFLWERMEQWIEKDTHKDRQALKKLYEKISEE